MKIEELMKFIDIEDKRLKEKFGDYDDKEKEILARTVKLNEELGGLCNEILVYNSLQRREKLDSYNLSLIKSRLEEEYADIIITALLLAKSTKTGILKALENKIEKINQRYKK